jgi:cAMP phosphodiesterase
MRQVHNSITVLGAHGAKSSEGGSSSFYLNAQHVVDAGNLLLPLEEKSVHIETIWLTHSHLDHIADIAYILDNYYEERTKSLKIYALEETIEALQKHFFNNKIWPDFSKIPLHNAKEMTITYHEVNIGEEYPLGDGKTVQAFLGDHSVPSIGYKIRAGASAILLSADTYSLEHIVQMVKEDASITSLVLECSFPIRMAELARMSKHLTADYLFEGISTLEELNLTLYINHIKPVYSDIIKEEIVELQGKWNVVILEDNDTITF